MKVVLVSNYDLETVSDVLLAEDLTEEKANKMANEYNKNHSDDHYYFAVVRQASYVLWDASKLY